MHGNDEARLSRREREIMDIVYRSRRASAAQVLGELHEPPSYSAVTATIRILERKGHLRHVGDGNKYVYLPTVPRAQASLSALSRVLRTFFDDSLEKAVAAHLADERIELSAEELRRLAELIRKAGRKGK